MRAGYKNHLLRANVLVLARLLTQLHASGPISPDVSAARKAAEL